MASAGGASGRGSRKAGGGGISVLVIDDHAILRDGLRLLLEHEAEIHVIGEGTNGRQAVTLAKSLDPDVIIMDIAMPLLNGIDAALKIQKVAPRSRLLFLSAHADDPYIERVMSVGAAGYVLKQAPPSTLVRAIRTVHAGGEYISPAIKRRLRAASLSTEDDGLPGRRTVPHLSPREMEVLQGIAEGKANKQTAILLGISIKTVEKHRQRLMTKLDVHDVAGLVRYAVTAGIIECRDPDQTS